MKFKRSLLAIVTVSVLVSLTGCGGGEDTGSELLQMDVAGQGMVLPVDNATCVDRVEGTGARSAKAPVIMFSAFRLKWIPADKALFIGYIKITVTSSALTGGKFEMYLSNDEVAALLGAPGSTVEPTEITGNKSIVSNQSSNRNGAPNCNFVIGGLTLANPNENRPFTASVQIQLVGQATQTADGPAPGTIEVVRKSYSATAVADY